jgi:phenylacetate-coenzyme A ligase PaaK-like adenylate-forming protein
MSVLVEVAAAAVDRRALQQALERRLHEALAVKVAVNLVERGELEKHTGLSKSTKPKRLLDRRRI